MVGVELCCWSGAVQFNLRRGVRVRVRVRRSWVAVATQWRRVGTRSVVCWAGACSTERRCNGARQASGCAGVRCGAVCGS